MGMYSDPYSDFGRQPWNHGAHVARLWIPEYTKTWSRQEGIKYYIETHPMPKAIPLHKSNAMF